MKASYGLLKSTLVVVGLEKAFASQNCTFDRIEPSTELKWCSCGENLGCARLEVPLDYKDPTIGRASIALMKYAADHHSSDGPYKGLLLVNPGGPGASGVELVQQSGSEFQTVAGTNWDIVGFDPRGMFNSTPLVNCAQNFTSSTGLKKRDTVPRIPNQLLQELIIEYKELGAHCNAVSGGAKQAGPHMTSTVNARDLISIVDAFAKSEDGKGVKDPDLVNFYGLSYGTYIGQTLASMFPDRVGHLVLDGVVSPEAEQHEIGLKNILFLDNVFATYFIYCDAAGKTRCRYSTGEPKKTYRRFRSAFDQLDPQHAAAKHWGNTTDIERALVNLKLAVIGGSYIPLQGFSQFTDGLILLEDGLRTHNLTTFINSLAPTVALGEVHPDYQVAVAASDIKNVLYNKSLGDLEPMIRKQEKQSIFGDAWSRGALKEIGWAIKSDDIFEGPYGGNTTTPILFVANTFDPVTPIVNSQSAASRYTGARILTIDGTGHTAAATGNTCAMAKIKAYLQTARVPLNGSYCPLEKGPFGIQLNGTVEENLKKVGLEKLT